MHETQTNYMIAKANYEAMIAACSSEYGKIEFEEDSDEYISAMCDIDDAHHREELYKALVKAEEAMITWAHERVLKIASKRQRPDLVLVYESRKSPYIRRKLVDLAFRLDAR